MYGKKIWKVDSAGDVLHGSYGILAIRDERNIKGKLKSSLSDILELTIGQRDGIPSIIEVPASSLVCECQPEDELFSLLVNNCQLSEWQRVKIELYTRLMVAQTILQATHDVVKKKKKEYEARLLLSLNAINVQ
jgi:hypothetical protein